MLLIVLKSVISQCYLVPTSIYTWGKVSKSIPFKIITVSLAAKFGWIATYNRKIRVVPKSNQMGINTGYATHKTVKMKGEI